MSLRLSTTTRIIVQFGFFTIERLHGIFYGVAN